MRQIVAQSPKRIEIVQTCDHTVTLIVYGKAPVRKGGVSGEWGSREELAPGRHMLGLPNEPFLTFSPPTIAILDSAAVVPQVDKAAGSKTFRWGDEDLSVWPTKPRVEANGSSYVLDVICEE
jgi:hypothetical protein